MVGYNVKPENVIVVTTLLINRTSGEQNTRRQQIGEGKYDEEANLNLLRDVSLGVSLIPVTACKNGRLKKWL